MERLPVSSNAVQAVHEGDHLFPLTNHPFSSDPYDEMAKKTHYADNLYFLTELIQTLDEGLKLEIDSELFSDRFAEEIIFIDESLSKIFETLKGNTFLIGRTEFLRSLLKTKSLFASFLADVLKEKHPLIDDLGPFMGKFAEIEGEQHREIREIQQIFSNGSEEMAQEVVSSEEISFLLKDESE